MKGEGNLRGDGDGNGFIRELRENTHSKREPEPQEV